jgi:hypothetical protein
VLSNHEPQTTSLPSLEKKNIRHLARGASKKRRGTDVEKKNPKKDRPTIVLGVSRQKGSSKTQEGVVAIDIDKQNRDLA